ncbi:MAG: YcgN family cysteine cluster protein [Pseudomonadales bacterium]
MVVINDLAKKMQARYWENKTLEELSPQEWEQLCDHCGLCCLVRIQDADSGTIYDTNVICRHYDCDSSRCRSYHNREAVPHGCESLTPATVRAYNWLPDSCAYRVVMRGESLPATHPLLAGEAKSPVPSAVVRQFTGIGLVQDADDIDPACHLIALEDIG